MNRTISIVTLLLVLLLGDELSAFASFPRGLRRTAQTDASSVASPLAAPQQEGLHMTGFFDDIGKFFHDLSGASNPNSGDASNEHTDDDDDDEYPGSTRLVTIPVKSIKPGGLRLLLMFYLMGMQNTPEWNSWKADQPTRDEYVLDMYFHDRTAALMVTLSEDKVTIDRMGSTPSTTYLMQESVIVDGILDELQICVSQDDIADEDRLLLLPEPKDAIKKAREALAFG